jgi:hypothetical protein
MFRGQHCLADLQSQPAKSHQPNLGHIQFANTPEQLQANPVSATVRTDVPRMSTKPAPLYSQTMPGAVNRCTAPGVAFENPYEAQQHLDLEFVLWRFASSSTLG